MPEIRAEASSPATPEAVRVERRSRISMVWLVPLVAALIALWLGYKTITEQGPTITIRFQSAEGLEAGKSKIRYKDVDIGVVEAIALSDDLSHVIVTGKMTKAAEGHLRTGTRFWVVRPRLTAGGVSGLGTLVSGSYVATDPGDGAPQRSFVGLEEPPVISATVPGTEFALTAPRLGSLAAGTPIFYRGVQVGEALGYRLGDDDQGIVIPIFIRAPHDRLVRAGSRFWNASGFEVAIDAGGVRIKTESLQSILTGGIAFDTPTTAMTDTPSAAGATFPLYDSFASLDEAQYTVKRPFLLYFDGSVRGLVPGAPVEFRGIKIGSVTDVRLQFDMQHATARIPVTIELEPQRIELVGLDQSQRTYEPMARLVERGLRAKLQPGNLLTGQLTVAMDIVPDSPPAKLMMGGKYPEIPTLPSDIEEITRSVTGLLDKLSALPIERLAEDARSTIESVNLLIRSPSVQRAVQSLEGVAPVLDAAKRAMDEATKTLERANEAVGSAQDVIGRDSPVRRDLVEALRELRDAARALRLFADYLERHPDAVIRGKGGEGR